MVPQAAVGITEASPVVGWVEGSAVPEAALEAYLERLGGFPAGPSPGPLGALERGDAQLRALAAKALLQDTLLETEAKRLGLGPAASLERWVERLEEEGEASVEAPGDADARACYEANLHRYAVREARAVRHRLFAERAEAERWRLACLQHPPWGCRGMAGLGRDDLGWDDLGWDDLGWVERGQLAGPLEEVAFSASPPEVCGPVRSSFGWHLVAVEAARTEGVLPFSECREEIKAEILRARRASAFRHWWLRRLAEAVVVPDGAEHPLQKGLPASPHRH